MTQIYLPLDILANIADELHDSGDMKTLNSLSRCCHSIFPIAQRLLFHTVRLGSRTENDLEFELQRTRGIQDLIHGSPRILDYIRSLKLDFIARTDNIVMGGMANILERLKSLNFLQFTCFSSEVLDWRSLQSPLLFSTVLHVLMRDNIQRLSVYSISNFPLASFITRCAVLDLDEPQPFSIDITLADKIRPSSVTAYDNHCPPTIRHYSAAKCGKWPHRFCETTINDEIYLQSIDPPSIPLHFGALKTLHVHWVEDQDKKETSVLLDHAKSLEEFYCEVGPQAKFDGLSTLLTRSACSTLRKLSAIITHKSWPFFDRHFQNLTYELVALSSSSNVLQEIFISTNIYSSSWNLDVTKLGNLDRALSTGPFPFLSRVVFEVNIWQWQVLGGPSYEMLEEANLSEQYRQCFPGLLAIEGLSFICRAEFQGDWYYYELPADED